MTRRGSEPNDADFYPTHLLECSYHLRFRKLRHSYNRAFWGAALREFICFSWGNAREKVSDNIKKNRGENPPLFLHKKNIMRTTHHALLQASIIKRQKTSPRAFYTRARWALIPDETLRNPSKRRSKYNKWHRRFNTKRIYVIIH